jgi:hypothetical protein
LRVNADPGTFELAAWTPFLVLGHARDGRTAQGDATDHEAEGAAARRGATEGANKAIKPA